MLGTVDIMNEAFGSKKALVRYIYLLHHQSALWIWKENEIASERLLIIFKDISRTQ